MSSVSTADYEAAQIWTTEFYRLLDAGDLATLASTFLKPDVTFTYTNFPTLKGREAVVQILGTPTASPLAQMKHSIVDLVVLTNRLMIGLEGHVKFVNGDEDFMRGFVVLEKDVEETQASDYRVYGDFTPLMKARA